MIGGRVKRLVCMSAVLAAVTVGEVAAAQQVAVVGRGQKVYTDQKCAVCHAIAGQGNKSGSLDGVGSKLSAGDIRSWLVSAPEMAEKAKATRKPFMKSYTALSKEDLDALVAYLQSLKKS
jgi:mono/diheme cytochrome c family protein